ncbi:hypothetical protein PTUN_a2558 [Pseudoalteromonas tunicata]|nr:hypothetical protein PTUN_a2558 [Pseudoalteromonas tunicata]
MQHTQQRLKNKQKMNANQKLLAKKRQDYKARYLKRLTLMKNKATYRE